MSEGRHSEGRGGLEPSEAVVLARAGGPSAAEALTVLAHQHATHVRRLEHDLAWLRGQLDAARAPVEAELAAVSAELERLRALPEVRVGQRSRQVGRLLVRSTGREQAEPDDLPSAAVAPAAPTTTSGLGYPAVRTSLAVVVVRNRRAALGDLLAWLGGQGIPELRIIDNASSDPVTVEEVSAAGAPVHRLDRNLGPAAAWALGWVAGPEHAPPVLIVDGDTLPDTGCPDDLLARLETELDRDHAVDAVAPAASGGPSDPEANLPVMWLVRASAPPPHLMDVRQLGPPYAVRCASWGLPSDDPNERFARLADSIEQP